MAYLLPKESCAKCNIKLTLLPYLIYKYTFKLYLIISNKHYSTIDRVHCQKTIVILLIGRIKCSQIQTSFECPMQNHKNLLCLMLQFSTCPRTTTTTCSKNCRHTKHCVFECTYSNPFQQLHSC